MPFKALAEIMELLAAALLLLFMLLPEVIDFPMALRKQRRPVVLLKPAHYAILAAEVGRIGQDVSALETTRISARMEIIVQED